MSGATSIIAAEKVSKRFGAHEVLSGVSLPVAEQDVVCVVGPSGSGKTTLLRCLALLEEQYVATVHGAAYHMSPYLRISTATADDDLVEGLRRIQIFCEGLH